MRWLIILYANLACLAAALFFPREDLILRTYTTVIPAFIGIVGYLYYKYNGRINIKADVLIAIGVCGQFLLPSLYLVSVELNDYLFYHIYDYIRYYPDVALATLLGQTFFYIGYEMIENKYKNTEEEKSYNQVEYSPFRFFFVMSPILVGVWISRLLILATGSYYHNSQSDFMFTNVWYSILAQFNSFGSCIVAGPWVMVFATYNSNQHLRWVRTALGITILELCWYLPTGAREPVLATVMVILMAYIFIKNSIPVNSIIVGIVICIFYMSFINTYRSVIGNYVEYSEISASGMRGALEETNTILAEKDDDNSIDTVVSRLSDARSVAAILQNFPSPLSYWAGKTYLNALWAFVPRFLYPDKPAAIFPIQELGLFEGEGGSSPTTLIGEAYVNFGWFGLFLVMPFIGMMACRYDLAFYHRSTHLIWTSIYVGISVMVVRLHVQTVSVWIGILIKAFLLGFLLTKFEQILLLRSGER